MRTFELGHGFGGIHLGALGAAIAAGPGGGADEQALGTAHAGPSAGGGLKAAAAPGAALGRVRGLLDQMPQAHLGGAVAGGCREGPVDLQDMAGGIGDDDAFLRLEGGGSDAQVLLGLLALGQFLLQARIGFAQFAGVAPQSFVKPIDGMQQNLGGARAVRRRGCRHRDTASLLGQAHLLGQPAIHAQDMVDQPVGKEHQRIAGHCARRLPGIAPRCQRPGDEIPMGTAMRFGVAGIDLLVVHHPIFGTEMVSGVTHQFIEHPQQIVVRRPGCVMPGQAIEHRHQLDVLVVDFAQADVEAVAPAKNVVRKFGGVHPRFSAPGAKIGSPFCPAGGGEANLARCVKPFPGERLSSARSRRRWRSPWAGAPCGRRLWLRPPWPAWTPDGPLLPLPAHAAAPRGRRGSLHRPGVPQS